MTTDDPNEPTADEDDRRRPMAGDMPNELAAAAAFPTAEDRPLREQRSLIDEDGDDIRQYTGEPVETEFGVIVPQQMAVGADRVVGGGEYPNTPGRGPRRPGDPSAPDDEGRPPAP